jgi:hypothetical protein
MWSKLNKVAIAVFVFLFSIFGIQSSHADYYPSGIQQNVSEQTLRDNGWTLFYQETYATGISSLATELKPNGQYVILTGKPVGSSTLPLLAAAPTSQVFTYTTKNVPQLINGTYWYFTDGQYLAGGQFGSIGFAPNDQVDQFQADVAEGSDPLRLSWHLNYTSGGYRLGAVYLNDDATYLKQVWTWNGPAAPAPKPVETYVRKSTNLQFNEAMYGSDKLSDPDGQLRKTVDAIDAKYGYLIK